MKNSSNLILTLMVLVNLTACGVDKKAITTDAVAEPDLNNKKSSK